MVLSTSAEGASQMLGWGLGKEEHGMAGQPAARIYCCSQPSRCMMTRQEVHIILAHLPHSESVAIPIRPCARSSFWPLTSSTAYLALYTSGP